MAGVSLPPQGRCLKCGYDLRGSNSDRCPECGAGRPSQALTFPDARGYYRAKAALQHAGLLVMSMDPSGADESGLTGRRNPGWLWVERDSLDQAGELLDELGILNPINVRPLVDRAEPICPRCEAALDPHGQDQCPHCNALFTWVEIEGDVPEGDTLH